MESQVLLFDQEGAVDKKIGDFHQGCHTMIVEQRLPDPAGEEHGRHSELFDTLEESRDGLGLLGRFAPEGGDPRDEATPGCEVVD